VAPIPAPKGPPESPPITPPISAPMPAPAPVDSGVTVRGLFFSRLKAEVETLAIARGSRTGVLLHEQFLINVSYR